MKNCECIKLENQICFSLYAASREVIKLYKSILDKHNLTYTQYLAMLVLWEEEKMTVKDIGKRLHLDSGTLTPLLKKLESMGLITRHRDVNDDRVVIIELTEAGLKLKSEILDVPGEVFCKLNISNDEAKELKRNLDNLLQSLE
ncbi:MarR family transcriptional regulator [Clostridium sulfidigenes]|jgi:MarR family transcriptional regulator, organic hydroperoxide resistance regulator|uniref:MarR family transcriptional regulator n=1 Tax=Clostridium sulfidigenes TaxID=318464 RepID=A0A084J8J9_9CLOT|nr:MarR family transcriptional regulator [Clostridium sulfidigenes]HAR85633.1 MarR family transcriptional regulator [Clostridium sp.]HAY3897544.1 MarR family transcriptional regulator [Escherichia coli]KEZ85283.1 MarR family transcriptional regulator [Clostridium sulfidigenes]HBA03037.1 MarR family transcriptional regulator [Clostridium sp.]HCO74571.1 MarR family transcriptional regulator [Clostridium sp.]